MDDVIFKIMHAQPLLQVSQSVSMSVSVSLYQSVSQSVSKSALPPSPLHYATASHLIHPTLPYSTLLQLTRSAHMSRPSQVVLVLSDSFFSHLHDSRHKMNWARRIVRRLWARWEREKECVWERECERVCVCERESVRECVCVWQREKERMFLCVRERERKYLIPAFDCA